MQPMVNFNLKCFLDTANELLRADETARALWLLDNLPAYYRQHVPKEVHDLKREVMSKIATASFYATSDGYELTAPEDTHLHAKLTLRGKLLCQEVEELNKNDLMPHIVDIGPGEYSFVRMLNHNNLLFTYEPVFVNHPSFKHYSKHFEEKLGEAADDRPKILFAGEIIEHLWNENEIRFEMERHMGLADVVHISTPAFTFDYQCLDWRSKGDLGHLRAYTPNEFQTTVWKMFPEYNTTVFVSQILHARSVLQSTRFEVIKTLKVEV